MKRTLFLISMVAITAFASIVFVSLSDGQQPTAERTKDTIPASTPAIANVSFLLGEYVGNYVNQRASGTMYLTLKSVMGPNTISGLIYVGSPSNVVTARERHWDRDIPITATLNGSTLTYTVSGFEYHLTVTQYGLEGTSTGSTSTWAALVSNIKLKKKKRSPLVRKRKGEGGHHQCGPLCRYRAG